MKIKYGLLLLMLFTSAFAMAQNYSLIGNIKDASNQEALPGATVAVQGQSKGVLADIQGDYRIALAKGTYQISFLFVGYEEQVLTVNLQANQTLNVQLIPEVNKLEEFVVSEKKADEQLTRVEMGVETMEAKTIKSIPALMGEVDIIKAIQLLPGVQSTSEGGSGFSVRGGTPDQNLILLDDATIYNASHLLGFFSVFNNDAVQDIQLYKGDMPANYGGRLSSLLNVQMKEASNQQFSGEGGVGTISSRLTLEVPLVKGKTSLLLSGRRTYMDLFLLFSPDEDLRQSTLYFYDFNGKISHRINENNRLSLSSYLGRDVFGVSGAEMGFGNKSTTLKWDHSFSPQWFMDVSAIYTGYDYKLATSFEESMSFQWLLQMQDYGGKVDFHHYLSENNQMTFGLQSTFHDFSPGDVSSTAEGSAVSEIKIEQNNAWEHALYFSHQLNVLPKLTLKYGLRASLFQNVGETTVYEYDEQYEVADSTVHHGGVYNSYGALEPRIGFSYRFNSDWAVKANYLRTVQYIQQASNSSAGSPLDVWFTASPNLKPQYADQYAVGMFRNLRANTIELSLESYYKEMINTIDFADYADLMLNKYIEGEVRTGSSKAYGVEFMAKKTKGVWSGWVSYTYSRAFRTIADINEGREYVAPFDKPHEINTVLTYDWSKRVSVSANWLYASGQPVTLPVQRFEIAGDVVPLYTQRNGTRYDPYHRLDLSLTLRSKEKVSRKWSGEWVFSVYNAYNRHNTWMLNFVESETNSNELVAEKTYLFPIVPSVTYNFKF